MRGGSLFALCVPRGLAEFAALFLTHSRRKKTAGEGFRIVRPLLRCFLCCYAKKPLRMVSSASSGVSPSVSSFSSWSPAILPMAAS